MLPGGVRSQSSTVCPPGPDRFENVCKKRPVDVLARHAYANRFERRILVGKCRAGHVPEVSIARQHEAAVEKPVLRLMHKIVHRNRSGGKARAGHRQAVLLWCRPQPRSQRVAVPKADARSGWPGPCTATSRMRCPSRSCPVLMSGAAAARVAGLRGHLGVVQWRAALPAERPRQAELYPGSGAGEARGCLQRSVQSILRPRAWTETWEGCRIRQNADRSLASWFSPWPAQFQALLESTNCSRWFQKV